MFVILTSHLFILSLVLATVSSISGGNDNDTPLRIYESSKSMEFSTDLSGPAELSIDGDQANGLELPLFNFNCVAVATNNFSEKNKLGEGGFGPVYKVMNIYVKYLCKNFEK